MCTKKKNVTNKGTCLSGVEVKLALNCHFPGMDSGIPNACMQTMGAKRRGVFVLQPVSKSDHIWQGRCDCIAK